LRKLFGAEELWGMNEVGTTVSEDCCGKYLNQKEVLLNCVFYQLKNPPDERKYFFIAVY
jgi:hypothetical protein